MSRSDLSRLRINFCYGENPWYVHVKNPLISQYSFNRRSFLYFEWSPFNLCIRWFVCLFFHKNMSKNLWVLCLENVCRQSISMKLEPMLPKWNGKSRLYLMHYLIPCSTHCQTFTETGIYIPFRFGFFLELCWTSHVNKRR